MYNQNAGPCYRCIFPTPPSPETVTNCGDGGVIGAVPGVIGTLQALEAIKLILSLDGVLSGRLLLFDGSQASFRTVRLRGKRDNCDICSSAPLITTLIDYEQFCGMKASDKDTALTVLESSDRITVNQYNAIVQEKVHHMLIDVRSANEFAICNIPHSINVPIKDILSDRIFPSIMSDLKRRGKLPSKFCCSACVCNDQVQCDCVSVFVVCRRGNDSQIAVKRFNDAADNAVEAKDIIGGLHSWAQLIDQSFPVY